MGSIPPREHLTDRRHHVERDGFFAVTRAEDNDAPLF
jgi:hypothetical protein